MTKDDSISIIYKTIEVTLEAQEKQRTSLETKGSMLIAFAGGIFALLMGANETLFALEINAQFCILISIILFALSVIFANIAVWIRKFRSDPNPEILAKNYLNEEPEKIKLQLISNMIGTWNSNRKILERNATFLRLTFLTQLIAFIFLGAALILSIV